MGQPERIPPMPLGCDHDDGRYFCGVQHSLDVSASRVARSRNSQRHSEELDFVA